VSDANDEMVKILIENGADASIKDADGKRAEDYCKESYQYRGIKDILKKSDPTIALDRRLLQVLTNYPVSETSQNLCLKLITEGATGQSLVNGHEMTALHLAVLKSYKHVVEEIIKKGENVNIRDKFGDTPLMFAVQVGNIDIIKILVKSGASNIGVPWEISGKTVIIDTPLHLAARDPDIKPEVLKCLLELGFDINSTCSYIDLEVIERNRKRIRANQNARLNAAFDATLARKEAQRTGEPYIIPSSSLDIVLKKASQKTMFVQ
jgi:hypothetical protein